MSMDQDSCYRAFVAGDARFDGLFFVGVRTTGIYCRPVCSAKKPGRDRCTFYASAALAERAGFRPCLRCRPELAPGHAPVDDQRTIATTAAARIQGGALNQENNLQDLADELSISSRQLRRVMREELGVTPVALAQTHRLLLAKRLMTETRLPLAQVALAAGFGSVRRFNAVFSKHYRLNPRSLRKEINPGSISGPLRLTLAYRPPLPWEALLQFLGDRAIDGVECVTGQTYQRTVAIANHRGWLSVSPVAGRHLLSVEMAPSLTPVLPQVLGRLRNLFDLDARPDLITAHLSADPLLASWVQQWPGLRVPGAFDSFEVAVRAVLGQQISVRGASTLAGRCARTFGEPIDTPLATLNRIAPTAVTLAHAGRPQLAALGLTGARAECLWQLAKAMADGQLDLGPAVDMPGAIARLQELPGIGPWTAHYMAMRILRWPDAFPDGDLGLIKATGLGRARALQAAALPWRPWRAYAAMYLWQSIKHRGT